MKSLETILKMREKLRKEVKKCKEEISELREEEFSSLTDEEKFERSQKLRILHDLILQIDALSYVINYDAEIIDVTSARKMAKGAIE